MVLGGVFDRFPNLQVIIGHLGEGIPFMLPRLERNFPQSLTQLKRPTGSYFRENVYYTFGGFNFAATFQNLLQEVGANRILFSVDYPYGSMVEAQTFLGTLPLAERDRQAISHRNAETLLHL
jgi:predicted TIM-barrel fold metal-dependent hydrolase